MKIIRRIAILFAFIAAFTNCENAYVPLVPEQENSEFALYLHHNTRTVNDGYSTKWVQGDKVNVFHAEAGTNNL